MNSQTETITCPCGTSFEWNNPNANEDQFWRNYGRPTICPACEAIAEENSRKEREAEGDKIAAEWLESFRQSIIASMPPLFRATDINHPKFNRRAWDKI